MHERDRRSAILGAMAGRAVVPVRELVGITGASSATLRRDLSRLEQEGLLDSKKPYSLKLTRENLVINEVVQPASVFARYSSYVGNLTSLKISRSEDRKLSIYTEGECSPKPKTVRI